MEEHWTRQRRNVRGIPGADGLVRRLTLICRYQNVITGSFSSKIPVERVGGILADEMGLGKTLTVLATILRTAKEAASFSENSQWSVKITSNGAVHTEQIYSKATLVVVPSARKSPLHSFVRQD